MKLLGANAEAYKSKEPEVLLAGAAGTGKSLALLTKVLTLCDKYPGARVLIVRKTRESLTESVLVTWERDILAPGTTAHGILTKNPTLRRVRQSYQFPNGSVVVVGGMDKPDKVLSSEWDFIYVPESTDLELVDWETLAGRLRAGRVPFQQIAGDCNPTSPHFWLYKRQAAGLCRMFTSVHKDNPAYWDRDRGEWTEQGRAYMARLERMTGARRDRFLNGLWVTAEGLVYAYDPDRHLLAADWKPPADWPRFWGLDWGYTVPMVLQFWAVDGDGRAHLYRERYMTKARVELYAKWARDQVELGHEPMPVAAVCDHDPECGATFREYGPRGLSLHIADKADKDAGLEAVQGRFDDEANPRSGPAGRSPTRPH